MSEQTENQRFYTTAPEAYDGFSTCAVEANAGTDQRGQIVRVVEIDAVDVAWQTGRYASGLHAAMNEEMAAEMFDGGLWTRKMEKQ